MQDEHALGGEAADLTLVEYGSYNCPYCKAAHDVVGNLRDRFGERLRYVFRHRPITGDDTALRAAELAEYAHQKGDRFWELHDALMQRGPGISAGADGDGSDAERPDRQPTSIEKDTSRSRRMSASTDDRIATFPVPR